MDRRAWVATVQGSHKIRQNGNDLACMHEYITIYIFIYIYI